MPKGRRVRMGTCQAEGCRTQFTHMAPGPMPRNCPAHRVRPRAAVQIVGGGGPIPPPEPEPAPRPAGSNLLIDTALKMMPPPGTPWPERDRWLLAFAAIIDLIYPDVDEPEARG